MSNEWKRGGDLGRLWRESWIERKTENGWMACRITVWSAKSKKNGIKRMEHCVEGGQDPGNKLEIW